MFNLFTSSWEIAMMSIRMDSSCLWQWHLVRVLHAGQVLFEKILDHFSQHLEWSCTPQHASVQICSVFNFSVQIRHSSMNDNCVTFYLYIYQYTLVKAEFNNNKWTIQTVSIQRYGDHISGNSFIVLRWTTHITRTGYFHWCVFCLVVLVGKKYMNTWPRCWEVTTLRFWPILWHYTIRLRINATAIRYVIGMTFHP